MSSVASREQRTPVQRHRIDADPESVERGLVSLVLTIVELLRQLMERQALRRVDDGTLSDDQIDMICAAAPYVMAMTRRLRRERDFREEPANIFQFPE